MNRRANALENEGLATAELAEARAPLRPAAPARIQRLGRLRIPIAGPYRPWATAYRLPDGRVVWCLRLWEHDRPLSRCVPTATLRTYCRLNRLWTIERDIARIAEA